MLKKIFKINNNLYSETFINLAIKDYTNITEIIYVKGKLTISGNNNEDITEVFNEFMNYVLYLHNISN